MVKSSFETAAQVLLWLLPVCASPLGVRGRWLFPTKAMPEVVAL
jgi:hypothetical protein